MQGVTDSSFACSEYDWSSVEYMVAPYLDGGDFTSLVMQGQSQDYRPASAAEHALIFRNSLPDEVVRTLKNIRRQGC